MKKYINYQVPSDWHEDGLLMDRKFSFLVFLAIIRDSKRNPNEQHRYKHRVYAQSIQKETGLSLNTVKKKIQYMQDKEIISIDEDGTALIGRFEKSKYVLLTNEEVEMLLKLGGKSENSIRMYIYLKSLHFVSRSLESNILVSQDKIAERIGLSINNRSKIKEITKILTDSKLVKTNKSWVYDKTLKKSVLNINYRLPKSQYFNA